MESIKKLRKRESSLLSKKGSIEVEWAKIRDIEGVELPSLKRRLENELNRVKTYESRIKEAEALIRVQEERIRELEARMPEEERKRVEKLSIVAGEVKALKEYLEGIKRRIDDLGDVGRELTAVEEELAGVIWECEELERKLVRLRRDVALEFRRIANELVKSLGFTWFKAILLDEHNGSYFVRVIRALPSGREERQRLRQLSTSERVCVALTAVLIGYKLGMAAGYPQDRLMVLADEALLAFDPERYEKIVEELKKYGRYVVVTKLAEPAKIPKLAVIYKEDLN